MTRKLLFNDNWKFKKTALDVDFDEAVAKTGYENVDLPHDWLIYDSHNLYEDGRGWYRKNFSFKPEADRTYAIRFGGVYMDCEVYVNGQKAGEWKYGYNTFEINITAFLVEGSNEIVVKSENHAPNSRWYSGAGIFRNVYFMDYPVNHLVSDGIYISTVKTDRGYKAIVLAEAMNSLDDAKVFFNILDKNGSIKGMGEATPFEETEIFVEDAMEWSLDNPYLYTLDARLCQGDETIDEIETKFGFRTIEMRPEGGFFLNGRHVKINGVCMHHDLGCLGAAVNRDALLRQVVKMKEMGANAIRTSHNMPAEELLEIADELGMLINDEAFDMWKIPKCKYDYSRFFEEWAAKDIRNFVRRDRNHPCVILWSVGNEIYDTHADAADGEKSLQLLLDAVKESDPRSNAKATIGSNFMDGENTQKCAGLLEVVGYNYAERLYDEHHEKYPQWTIYGSETCSTLQSRSVYHFPYSESILTDLDEQCSSIGNCTTSWGAKNTEACIIAERDCPYSMGQFIWTGWDYIGEPTPYQTKNSYFGQVDTAGFEKDTFYIFQAEWTDYKEKPMVHVFPFWDFNEGQLIDVRVASNAPEIELFFNGQSKGRVKIDHAHGKDLVGHWVIPYSKGRVEAVAYDENGTIIARDFKESFTDAVSIKAVCDRDAIFANGTDLVFVEINMLDEQGRKVDNANNRVNVKVSGPGRLVGLDNGDSTDYESYKGTTRKLFMGKLLAVVSSTLEAGEIEIEISSPGIKSEKVIINSRETQITKGVSANTCNFDNAGKSEIPIRKINLVVEQTKDPAVEIIKAELLPANCTWKQVSWTVVNDAGVETNLAAIEADGTTARLIKKGDGHFNVRCYSNNGCEKVNVISQLGFDVQGLGPAFINPYETVSASLYDISGGELGNAEEHGVATQKGQKSYFGFSNMDFGEFGTNEVEISFFAFDQKDYVVRVWDNVPGAEGSVLLMEGIYNKPVIWGVYQSEKFMLNRRIKGVHTICVETEEFVNIKEISFGRLNKGTSINNAAENDSIYGDDYRICESSVNDIGNNVSLEFKNMDFGEGVTRLKICGTSKSEINTINVIFSDKNGNENRELFEFLHTDKPEIKVYNIKEKKGVYSVTFVFLPGSNFDFDWFQFE